MLQIPLTITFTREQIIKAISIVTGLIFIILVGFYSQKIVDIEQKRSIFLSGGTVLCFEANTDNAINLNSKNALLTQTSNIIIQKPNIIHKLSDCYGIVEPIDKK